MSEFILEYHYEPNFGPGDQRKWRMGLTKADHQWLTDSLGLRAKRPETWEEGKGAWRYLGSTTKAGSGYKIRIAFRSKSQALLFKLARLGQI